jgi:hypothetical protein
MALPTEPKVLSGARGLPGLCSVCGAAPSLVAVEANGVPHSRSTLCKSCFAVRYREQRARHVTPIGGLPLHVPRTR